MRLNFLFIALLSCLCLSTISSASDTISGFGELRYGEYEAKEDGRKTVDAQHFTQQYSLMWGRSGQINKGRGGKYSLGFGFEWTSVDSEVNSEGLGVTTKKLLYNGDLLLAPGGLPFRLHVYSHDLKRTTLQSDINPLLGQRVISPGIVTGVNNGQHYRSGLTLMVGIRNGSYLGRYREMLSQFPRFLIDFQEDYVRDLKSLTPQHYRHRNLAFVSLNKKDNWFHFRYNDYKDFMRPQEDYFERSYTLGTIDHTLQRKWINFTNWIKVSVDGTFAVTNRQEETGPDTERYDINMFGVAKRNRIEASAFTNAHRVIDPAFLEKEMDIPLFIQGEPNRNTSWRIRLVGNRYRRDVFSSNDEQEEDDIFSSGRAEIFKQGRYVFAPTAAFEVKRGNQGRGSAVSVGAEAYTNNRFQPKFDLFSAVKFTYLDTVDSQGAGADYWESVFSGHIETQLDNTFRSGFDERLIFGTGTVGTNSLNHIGTEGAEIVKTLGSGTNILENADIVRSISTLFVEHRMTSRLDNRVELIYDYISQSGDDNRDGRLFTARHHLRYSTWKLSASWSTQADFGSGDRFASASAGGNEDENDIRRQVFSGFSLRYTPSRMIDSSLIANYQWDETASGSRNDYNVTQSFSYNFFSANGLVRRIAQIGEGLEYDRQQGAGGGAASTVTTFTLLGNYYPTRASVLGAKFRYRNFRPQTSDEYALYLTAGMNFSKLQLSLDYSYGNLQDDDAEVVAVKEHRWEMRVKKTF